MRIPEMAESEAIQRAMSGDESGYEALYHLHRRRIYSVCLRSAGNAPDAEDLTQEVFLQVYRRLSTFRGEAKFGSWLYRVAINCVRMRFRRSRPEVSLSVVDTTRREFGSQECAHPFERAVLGRAIGSLSSARRRVVLLYDVKGLTHKEIAQRLGVAVSTSKSQLCRAHLMLRDILGKNEPRKDKSTAKRSRENVANVTAVGSETGTFASSATALRNVQ